MKTIETTVLLVLILIAQAAAQDKDIKGWNNKRCAVVLTYDDGLNVHLDKVIPVLDSLGLKATFYIPGNSSSLARRLPEWRSIAAHGHELGNHTLFHPCTGKSKGRDWVKPEYDLDSYTVTRMLDEIRAANTLLHAIDGKTRRTFAYTCGDKLAGGLSFVDSVRNDFIAARGVNQGIKRINEIDLSNINAFMVNGQSADDLIGQVKKAKEDSALLVFLFHGVGGEHSINISQAEHRKLLNYLKANENDIWVAPLVEVSEKIREYQQAVAGNNASGKVNGNTKNNARYVNLFIGTDGTGHTFPGPSMPFGMVQPGPDNRDQGWNHTSGYQYRDSIISGFSQTRFSGTGISEMGDVLLLPYVETSEEQLTKSYFKGTETASVGYYSVIKKDSVKVELTASERVAFHKYTFPVQQARILVDLQHGLCFLTDSLVLDSDVNVEDKQTISGYCHTKNWVERKYFFVIKFDTLFEALKQLPKGKKENAPKYILSFNLNKNKILQAKIALSTVDVAGAKLNLQHEIPHWNFSQVRRNAELVWNEYLGRIDIEADTRKKELFYTSLYHLLLQPSNIADVNGKYRGANDKIGQAVNNEYYSTLSIWDVYRGAFPLLEIIAPEKISGIVNSMLMHCKAAGFLPIWTAWGQDNYCMIGNHAIPMILSAINKGFPGIDKQEALKAMVETSTKSHINSDWALYNQYGFYPYDKLDNEAVSRTLESGYDDWCVAQLAEKTGDLSIAKAFYKRADYYKNLFDPGTRMFRGKDTKGNWRTPFNPFMATSPMNNPGDYTEANAWQYFWTPAQYDIDGMKQLLGGNEAFTKQLNDFFTIETLHPDKYLGQEAMIGQYAHGNEPSHHVAYLYAYSNTPKTGQKYIHHIINDFHNDTPDGMIGNDDCGQMSAWYILSSLGFYPVNPAGNEFVMGAPQLQKATIHLSHQKHFVIEAINFSLQNIYAEKAILNGKPIDKPFITYEQIMSGGDMRIIMSKE